MKLEQVYELNLLPFNKVKNDNFLGFMDNDKSLNYLYDNNLNVILQNKWLNFLDLDWYSYRYFKKSLTIGSIHSDLPKGYTDYCDNKCAWGINWIFNGSGKIHFWHFENTEEIGQTTGSLNKPENGIAPKYYSCKQPDYIYDTMCDKVYLINASLPHRAIGYNQRSVFSLRTKRIDRSWKDVLDIFRNYIV